MKLFIGNSKQVDPNQVNSIFRLLGKNEDALTFALGYLLSQDIKFLKRLCKRFFPTQTFRIVSQDVSIVLQEFRDDKSGGRRDITIYDSKNTFKIVFEAKINGDIPTEEQLSKYLFSALPDVADDAYYDREWKPYKASFIAPLTRMPILNPDQRYGRLLQILMQKNLATKIVPVQWHHIIELIKSYEPDSPELKYLFNQFLIFIKEDYRMSYFEQEVLCKQLDKGKGLYSLAIEDPFGFHFTGGRKISEFPPSLFFAPCYGGQKNSNRRAEFLRRIDNYEILSSAEIYNRPDLQDAFATHVAIYGVDANADRIHVFTLGKKIRIPEAKQRFQGGSLTYKRIDDFLE